MWIDYKEYDIVIHIYYTPDELWCYQILRNGLCLGRSNEMNDIEEAINQAYAHIGDAHAFWRIYYDQQTLCNPIHHR